MRNIGLIVLLLATSSAQAATDYPTLLGAYPAGLKRGESADILIYSWRSSLAGAYGILFDGDPNDFQATILSDGKQGPLSVRVKVSPGARPGIRQFRVATPQGVSTVAALAVGDDAGIREVEVHDTPEKAQVVSLPATIHGRLHKPEKVDWYQFHAEAGDEISFAVLASRLQSQLYYSYFVDPMLILADDRGNELASNDDYFAADPFLRYRFSKAGEYRIAIRDNRFRGEMPSSYLLTITRQPYLLNVSPLAVERGQSVDFRPVVAGDPPETISPVPYRIPSGWETGNQDIRLKINGQLSNPVPLMITDLPTRINQQANQSLKTAGTLSVNSGVNGLISESGRVDWYRMDAKKGESYLFEVFARRYQSDLDSILSIHDAKGKELASNDDTVIDRRDYMSLTTKDSRIIWTAPEDTTFYIRLADAHGNGGPSFPYFLTCRVARPDFLLWCEPDDKANIGPGCSTTWHFHLERFNGLAGPVEIHVEGLPEGVTASRLVFPDKTGEKQFRDHNGNQHREQEGILVLSASSNARMSAQNVRVTGTAKMKGPNGTEISLVKESRPLMGRHYQGPCLVRMQSVAISATSTLVVVPSSTEANLAPGGSCQIDFEVKRGPDLPADFRLVFGPQLAKLGIAGVEGSDPFPPGVSVDLAKSKVRLAPGESRGWIVLNATSVTSPVAGIPFSVMASAGTDGRRPILYSTPAIYLTITPSKK